ncbi:hypothetical protein GDO78_002890 [Eleutherodactylus coqui]|uniref:Uncharacterized protein n=1 Tax=Eleutherodactylus coqui TaxID=57060 RepID=A0A8J6K5H1_ELECQ|nr:hypothetical protein GDO78_002890 [Eleutherodactylus coqui]
MQIQQSKGVARFTGPNLQNQHRAAVCQRSYRRRLHNGCWSWGVDAHIYLHIGNLREVICTAKSQSRCERSRLNYKTLSVYIRRFRHSVLLAL